MTIPFILRLVGPRFAKLASWAFLAALALAVSAVAKCTYDRNLIATHDAKVSAETVAKDVEAKDAAALERARDTIAIDEAEKERNDVIQKGPAGRPDDARTRLNCRRLQRSGQDTSGIAACR